MGDAAKRHKSLFGRAKRALTTKTVGLKAGRKAITKIVGDEGAEMITAVKAAIALHYGHDRGKAAKVAIMKLAAKVKYLADEGFLVEENTKPAVEPLNALGLQLLFLLNQTRRWRSPPKDDDPDAKEPMPSKYDLKPLTDCISQAKNALGKVITTDMMQEKNRQLMFSTIDELGDAAFLEKVFYDPEYAPLTNVIHKNLAFLMAPWLDRFQIRAPCQMPRCFNAVARTAAGYSKYCDIHHDIVVNEETKDPTLELWLRDVEKQALFADFFAEKDTEHKRKFILPLLRAIRDYRQIEGDRMLRNRAQTILRTYLTPGGNKFIEVDSKAVDQVRGKLEEHAGPRIFDPVEELIRAELEDFFSNVLLPSDRYRQYWEGKQLMGTTEITENDPDVIKAGNVAIRIDAKELRRASITLQDAHLPDAVEQEERADEVEAETDSVELGN